MNRFASAVLLAALIAGVPAYADPADSPPVLNQRVLDGLSLDDLFDKLAASGTSPPGERVEHEILRRFGRSGSPTADLLMSWAVDAIDEKDFPLALDVLDQVIVVKPDFAEAWNKRATVYFFMEDLGDSLSDIRQTLALQPRHFGALAGFGMILQAMDRKEEAIRVYRRALEINPRLDRVRDSLKELEKETAGDTI